MNNIEYICIFCGYKDFVFPNYEIKNNGFFLGNFTICPSCGAEFGFDDDAAHTESPKVFGDEVHVKNTSKYRCYWIQSGMFWRGEYGRLSVPENWNPIDQLKQLPEEFKDDLVRSIVTDYDNGMSVEEVRKKYTKSE